MIRELTTFMAVAREGTFASAGAKIGLTQAAVSAQMKRLEAELGFEVFDRSGRTARLNTLGQDLLLQAQGLLQAYSQLGSGKADQTAVATLTLGAIASVQRTFLPDVLTRFHKQAPNCRTRVIPGLSMHLIDQVDAGEIDMAIIIRPPFAVPSGLAWTPLVQEPFRLLVPRKVTGNDWAAILASQPFVRYDRTSFGGRQVDRFLRAAHIQAHEICELDELDAIVRLVANGLGVALLPQTTAPGRWPAATRAIDLGKNTFHRDIGLVHRDAHHLSEPARALAGLIAAGA